MATVVLAYWRNVSRRAVIEAAALLGIRSRGQIVIWLSATAIAVLALLLWGSADASWDEFVWRAAFAALIVLIYPFAFLWKLIALPPQIDEENRRQITALSAAQLTKQANVQRTRLLTVLLEQGLEILAETPTLDNFDGWAKQIGNWEIITLKFLATRYSHQDATAFKTIEFNPKKKFSSALNEIHTHLYLKAIERCHRLRSIVDRDPQTWSVISSTQREEAEKILLDFGKKVFGAKD